MPRFNLFARKGNKSSDPGLSPEPKPRRRRHRSKLLPSGDENPVYADASADTGEGRTLPTGGPEAIKQDTGEGSRRLPEAAKQTVNPADNFYLGPSESLGDVKEPNPVSILLPEGHQGPPPTSGTADKSPTDVVQDGQNRQVGALSIPRRPLPPLPAATPSVEVGRVDDAYAELSRVEAIIIRENQANEVQQGSLEAMLKNRGVAGCLQLLVASHKVETDRIGDLLSDTVTKYDIKSSTYPIVVRKCTNYDTLELVINRLQKAMAVERTNHSMVTRIGERTREIIPSSELERAFKMNAGLPGIVDLLLERLSLASHQAQRLLQIEAQVKETLLTNLAEWQVDELDQTGLENGILDRLLEDFRHYSSQERDYRRLESQLREGAVVWVDISHVHTAQAQGPKAVLDLLLRCVQERVEGEQLQTETLQKRLDATNSQYAVLEAEKTKLGRQAEDQQRQTDNLQRQLNATDSQYALLSTAKTRGDEEATRLRGEVQRAQAAYNNLVSENKAAMTRLQEESQSGKTAHNKLVKENKATVNRLQGEVESVRKAYNKLVAENTATVTRLEGEVQKGHAARTKLVSDNTAAANRLKGEVQRCQEVNKTLVADNNVKLAKMRQQCDTRLSQSRDEAASQHQESEARYKMELQTRQATYQSTIDEHAETLRSTKETHREALRSLQYRFDTASHEWQEHQKRIEQDCDLRIAELTSTCEQRIAGLVSQYEKRLQDDRANVEKENENLKGKLAEREHIKGLSDREVLTAFKTLTREIDHFSRIPWEKRKQSQWPLSDGVLARAQNAKKLRQIIVQTSIWRILNEALFQSPFAVFEEEGRALHREWTDAFGQEQFGIQPAWAEPSEESEKWRAELVKRFYDASGKAGTGAIAHEDRWAKEEFDQSLASTADEIHDAVETVANSDLGRVQELVRCAMRFWLELASQRYRARVVFPPGMSKPLGSRWVSLAGMQLVVQPEVRRRGNAQGQRLDQEQVIQGCESESVSADRM